MGWFAIKMLGLPRYLWIVLAIAAAVLLWVWVTQLERADDQQNQELGAAVERGEAATQTLERTEQGNEARTEIEEALGRDGGRSTAVYEQCLRTARTPANCQRFLPERQADQR